jgi:hypothetical protein
VEDGGMGETHDIAVWRARRAAGDDIPIAAPPFVLQEACPGCGARRVSTMVWRINPGKGRRVAFPRIEPHFLCREGRVLWQEITDAPIPVSAWSGILGQFEAAQEG